jgi:hypothetical protein
MGIPHSPGHLRKGEAAYLFEDSCELQAGKRQLDFTLAIDIAWLRRKEQSNSDIDMYKFL